MGITHQKGLGTIVYKTAHVCFRGRKWVHTRLSEKDRTQGLTRRNRGRFGRGRYHYPRHKPHVHEHPRAGYQNGVLCRFGILAGRCSRRTQKAFGTAMRLCVSLSRRRRGPAGLRDLFRFCRNLWLYAPHSGLSMRARWGWYHYPRRALRTAEVLGARLSKQLICRFLRLLSSILCAVPFSANMQISLSAISVANAFPPPTTAGLCASSRIASNRTTTVSLGCMDSSSFGCLIVLDSSLTYTTRS